MLVADQVKFAPTAVGGARTSGVGRICVAVEQPCESGPTSGIDLSRVLEDLRALCRCIAASSIRSFVRCAACKAGRATAVRDNSAVRHLQCDLIEYRRDVQIEVQMNSPPSASEISPEWLTSALRDAGHLSSSSAVSSLRLEPLHNAKAVFGSLHRLHIQYVGDPGGLPPTLIAKGPSANSESVAIMQRIGGYRQETQFYSEMADWAGLRTPKCYVSLINDTGDNFLLLLEDLSALKQAAGGVPSREEVEATVLGLATSQAVCWRKNSLGSFDWLRNVRSDTKVFHENFLMAWPKISARLGDGQFDIERLGGKIAETFLINHDLLGSAPLTFVVVDVRAENLFFTTGRAGVEATFIDFQFLRLGRGPASLGSFLATIPDRQNMEDDLVRLYHDRLRDGGVRDYSIDECFRDYWRGVIRRFVAPAGMLATVDADSPQGKALLEVVARFGLQDMERYADLLSGG
jgi:hypothetical protein